MHQGSRRAILAALAANSGIAVAKFIGFLVTGAASMQAEAVHSLADTGNQALLLWGGASSKREASAEHPFGYGRERYFWSFVVALVLFSLGSLFAIHEGVEKLRHPHEIEGPAWAVGILLVGIVLEGFSFRTAIKEAEGPRRGRSWWSFIRGTKNPELPVVILEDLGALCGLVMALASVGIAVAANDARFDAAGSIGIGVLLGAIAIVLAVEMKSLLIGEAATPSDIATLRKVLLADGDVQRIIHMRTLHIGPEELLVAAKLEFDSSLTLDELSRVINRLEERVRERLPIAKIIYIEPDVYESGATDPEAPRPAAS
jgi:cation diffusion facilitator family transporter